MLAIIDDPRHGADSRPRVLAATEFIKSGEEFVAGFRPPDYLVDGIIQRRFLYSFTAPTGTGKTAIALRIAAHVACGLPLGGRDVEPGKVLYFAGENPDDVRTRWIKLCEEMEIDPVAVPVSFVAGVVPLSKVRERILAEARLKGPFSLVVIDTLAAYFEGDEENSNTQMGGAARQLRGLTEIHGGPTVIVSAHPIKNATEQLLRRGGGAFLAEVDGNLVGLKQDGGVVDLHWQGKFRGPDFAPIPFQIVPGTSARLHDSRGRPIWTVTARPLHASDRAALEDMTSRRRTDLLRLMQERSGLSLAELADALGWPNKGHVKRAMDALAEDGLVKKHVSGHWDLTPKGRRASTGS